MIIMIIIILIMMIILIMIMIILTIIIGNIVDVNRTAFLLDFYIFYYYFVVYFRAIMQDSSCLEAQRYLILHLLCREGNYDEVSARPDNWIWNTFHCHFFCLIKPILWLASCKLGGGGGGGGVLHKVYMLDTLPCLFTKKYNHKMNFHFIFTPNFIITLSRGIRYKVLLHCSKKHYYYGDIFWMKTYIQRFLIENIWQYAYLQYLNELFCSRACVPNITFLLGFG